MSRTGFDMATLLRITGGNKSLADELIELLLSELPKHRADLNRAFAEGNLTTLAAVSHTLRGGGGGLLWRPFATKPERKTGGGSPIGRPRTDPLGPE